ncbi:MAG: type II toxin-antitoxin system HicA family toxin [Cyclobacteriaceae bacterium]
MKLPRNISGNELTKKLEFYGYAITRQVGSHMRITTSKNGVHYITIPAHKPLKVGTLSSIIREVGRHFHISKEEVINQLFD